MMRKLLALAMALCLVPLLSGCLSTGSVKPLEDPMYTEDQLDALYEKYNGVDLAADTLETLTKRWGAPQEEALQKGSSYVWQDEQGMGVAMAFGEDGKPLAKVVGYKDIRQFGQLSGARNLEGAAQFKEGDGYRQLTEAFETEGMEVAQIVDAGTGAVNRLMLWCSVDGELMVQALITPEETIKQINSSAHAMQQ